MNFTSFKKLGMVAVLAAALLSLTSCGSTTISEGNFGLSKMMLTGSYSRAPLGAGFNLGVISSISEFYGKEEMVKIDQIHPKDKDGVLLKDLDLIVTYKTNPQKAVAFFVQTGDSTYKRADGTEHLGLGRIDRDARATIGESIRNYSSLEILNNPEQLETKFKHDLQVKLDTLYGKDTFLVTNIKVSNILVSDVIEQRIQNRILIDGQAVKNNAIAMMQANAIKGLTVELQTLSISAKAANVTVDQALNFKLIKAIEDNPNANVQVTIPAKPKM
jgi:hypothetical protein